MRCFCVFCAVLTGLVMLLLLGTPSSCQAQQPASQAKVSFIRDIAPIIKENCLACHDAKKRKGKLHVGTYEALRKGGTKGDPIAPGKPDESFILDVLTATDNSRMPPKEAGDPLPKDKIQLIERWISEGANIDSGLSPQADLLRELRTRWQPPKQPEQYPFPASITALSFTPDGKELVAGGQHELTVWNVSTGKLVKRIRTRAERTYAMQYLPSGQLLVAGGRPGQEGDVVCYDISATTGEVKDGITRLDGVADPKVRIKKLHETDDSVLCLAVSADGKKLAAGGCDRMVHVWDISGGIMGAKLDQSVENHADWVFGVAFSPDGKNLITGSRDKTAKVWDLTAKESVLTFPDHQNTVYAVAVKPDGKVGYSVGEDNQLRFWNAVGEGKQIRSQGGHGKAVFRIVTHPKESRLLTCSADGSIRLWNADNGQNIRTMTGHADWVYAVALSPDGKLAASGDWNGEVRIWNLADGKLLQTFTAAPGLAGAKKDGK